MKKAIALVCVLCMLMSILPVQAESAWNGDAWKQVINLLNSSEPSPVPADRRMQISQGQVYLTDPTEQRSGWLNVALISTDAPDMRQNFGRSEALLVCRVHQKTGEFRLLSLPEYMTVHVDGLPAEIQLRHVNCFGGPLLALDTVNWELGLSVNRYCAINVDAFADIVDRVGGVTLTLTDEEAQALSLGSGTQTLRVHIPAGIDDGKSVRLRGKGHTSADGKRRGDLLLKVSVDPSKVFTRKGQDIYTTVFVPFTTAVLGGETRVQLPNGKKIICKVPRGTDAGKKIRIRGKGIQAEKSSAPAGDLFVTVQVRIPSNLTDAEIRKLQEFEKMHMELHSDSSAGA